MRSQALRSAAVRVGTLRLLLLGLFLVLAARAGQLTVVSTEGRLQGNRQIQTQLSLPGARGLILDRGHKELALSVDAPSVYVLPQLLNDRPRSLAKLAKILELDRRHLERRIADHKGFTFIARWVSDAQAKRVSELALPGVGIEREPRRVYPAGRLAAPLLGFADIDGRGVRGVEQMMDDWLKGAPRRLAVERDATGRLLCGRPLDPRVAAGGDLVLTIDAGLQAQAEAALTRAVEESGAAGGLVISVDPKTGDVLSLAESPGFDPNRFRHIEYTQTRSRAFLDVAEPGSTFKAFLVAAALEAGDITQAEPIDTGEGWMRVPGKTIRDHRAYGVLDIAGVLRVSSNVGAVQIAQRLGPERYSASLGRLGFGVTTGSGFPDESAGLLRDWRKWKPVDHATLAYGQGVSVTAMQLAMATATLAAGGERMRPRLVLARRRALGRWQQTRPVSLGQAISRETAQLVVGMLETVVSGTGTGRLAALADVRVAGKTGTAQKLERETGRYSQDRYTAWFIGIAPADDPRLAIVVALDEPKGVSHTGGSVAAPLFARVAAAQLARLGILTRPEPIPAEPIPTLTVERSVDEAPQGGGIGGDTRPPGALAATTIRPEPTPTPLESGSLLSVLVPDFHGESLAAARRLAAIDRLDLRVRGSDRGSVVNQSPAPGTILAGSERTVELSFAAAREEG